MRRRSSLGALLNRLLDGPPSHVVRRVPGSRLERLDAGDDVACAAALRRSGDRAWMFCEKGADGCGITLDLSVKIPHAVGAGGDVVSGGWHPFHSPFGNRTGLRVQNGT